MKIISRLRIAVFGAMVFTIGLLASATQSAYDNRQDDRVAQVQKEVVELRQWKNEHMDWAYQSIVLLEHRLTTVEEAVNTNNKMLGAVCVALVLLLIKALIDLISIRASARKPPG